MTVRRKTQLGGFPIFRFTGMAGYPFRGLEIFITEFSTYPDSCGISYGRDVLRNAVSETSTDEKPASGEVRSLETATEKSPT